MKLGAFSISLNVVDIQKSFAFYSKLGFTILGGDLDQNWVILKNENTLIGLFQGMIPQNILTFNPGWDEFGAPLDSFDDVRVIEKTLQEQDISLTTQTTTKEGPAHITLVDPDGNQILIDQHR